MKVEEVCCKCNCTEWVKKDETLVCCNCGTVKCSANKWFLVCEPEDIELRNGKEFFIGDLREHLGERV